MRRGLARNRWLGWMALVAVWLAVLVPTVSRSMPASFTFPDLGAWCEAVPGAHHDSRGADHGRDDGAACGYCTLFARTPVLGGAIFIANVLPPCPASPVRRPSSSTPVASAWLHRSPRGPPVVAYA